jgi:anti-anti-sigma factor
MGNYFMEYCERHPGSSARFERSSEGGFAARITVVGNLDTETTADFVSGALEALASMESDTKLELNLESVHYVSSTGVGSLVRLQSEAEKRRIALSILGMSPACRDVFSVLGLLRYFKIQDAATPITPIS